MKVLAVTALFLTVASLLVVGGVLFALFLFFPLFLLGLVGVFAGLEDHSVRQHDPAMDATSWRGGFSTLDASDRRDRAPVRPGDRDRRAAPERARTWDEPGHVPSASAT